MASTETRTGFRLPWISDAHPTDDGAPDNEAGDDPAATAPESAAAGDGSAESPEIADTSEIHAAEAPDTASDPAPTDAAASELPGNEVPGAVPTRRPTKFLADLARAMRSAAETERQEIIERFQADVKGFVESVRERSAVEATELRATADGDIAGIRDWSKAEIARIREETERRITERRSRLEREIEEQAARIERQVERVHGTVGAFEDEMARFFESLLGEEDPARIAALASSLPEPPSLDAVAAAAGAEPVAVIAEVGPDAPAITDEAGAAEEPGAGVEPVASVETPAVPGDAEETAAAATPSMDAAAPEPETQPGETLEPVALETAAEPGVSEPDAPEPEPNEPPRSQPSFDEDALTLDPRVVALGLTPDFDAAEAEAAADLNDEMPDDGSGEEIPVIDDEILASRLAGLVPATPAPDDLAETRVIVSGLVSVASIAGFKRALTRLDGVHSVSVSSGPDGEFVFAVARTRTADLGAAIATMPGFSARVGTVSDEAIEVVARDPDAA